MFCNAQVTFDASVNNARSECAISVNPRNPSNLVGASKRFTNPDMYEFSLAAYASFDGGVSWIEAAPFGLQPAGRAFPIRRLPGTRPGTSGSRASPLGPV